MPSSSLILSVGTVLASLTSTAFATKYDKHEVYNSTNWLDAFEFKQDELTYGYVNYVNEATAKNRKLYRIEGNDVVFGPDGTETLDVNGPGRKSVRLEGKTDYNKGLFILDVKQMPGVCGMWPSFWSLGREPWPVKGEIDIIEGVNDNQVNKMALHTDTNCKVNGRGQTNPQVHNDCAHDTGGTLGCDVNQARTNSFGKNFNNIKGLGGSGGGGYYVMEWDSDAIRTWFFPRDKTLPPSLTSDAPDTAQFGQPAANFQGDCNIEERIKDQRFIFTNNFCGDWAGNVFGSTPSCPLQKDDAGKQLSPEDSCKKYVAKNPDVFKNQAWRIGSFRTFKKKAVVNSSSSAATPSTSSSASTSSTSLNLLGSSTMVSSSNTTKVYNKDCRSGPKTVTVTVHCTNCDYVATPTPDVPAGKPAPAVPDAYKPTPMAPDFETIPTKIYQTMIITLSNASTPAASQSKSAEVPAASKPIIPAYGTGMPAQTAGNNGTMSVGTGVQPIASKTGYAPPMFTGAASGMQGGSAVALIAVAVAMVL
ncbi:hypothetical protein HBI49_131340 [Parastagonospora nodorum]|nr:hypothetical protein HBH51_142100 [Parastagonospora nodorum]KAH4069950.1 hypothetical protein HBH50_092060 [Parastagonospora nodorum]KAH4090515.1 hypothetical protein HBH48_095820 [Parastagonospora nodorum]KAH4209417.1 hypothetical protein HBI95_075440 [Parastagonospora nodorum]KAH4855413.1 hypothetical protein HBH75_080190 [Parastagonospora nodorum]